MTTALASPLPRLLPLVGAAWISGCAGPPEAPAAPARPEAPGAPMDGLPGARAVAAAAEVTAEVAPGGTLSVGPAEGPRVTVDHEVRAELALSADGALLVYARQAEGEDSDLYVAAAPWGDPPEALTDWPGAEDRPALSPDGSWVAFVSGRTGIASVWALSLPEPGEAVQLTNVGLEDAPRPPGQAPEGFEPPPQGELTWTAAGLRWQAEGRTWRVPADALAAALPQSAP